MADRPDPATQIKTIRFVAAALAFAGLATGFGIPALLHVMKIEVAMTSSGFDLIWLAMLALMVADFALAWYFWRRAVALDRAAQGLPP